MSQTGKHTSQKRRVPLFSVSMVLLVIAVLSLSVFISAKYVSARKNDTAAEALSFYFESDLLSVSTGAIPQYTLQVGVDTISFSLMNYPDELRSSEVNIDYTAVLTKDGTKVASESGGINAGRNSVTVSFGDLDAGTYIVTATADSPYSKTLEGKFTIVSTDYGLAYSVSDAAGSPNLKVTVTTTDYSGDIVISWPEGVLPDNTDALLKDAAGQSYTILVNAQSEYTFQFFKTNPNADYSSSIYVKKQDS